jgi:hypothetical protein
MVDLGHVRSMFERIWTAFTSTRGWAGCFRGGGGDCTRAQFLTLARWQRHGEAMQRWLKEWDFYVIGLIYMATKVTANVIQVYM